MKDKSSKVNHELSPIYNNNSKILILGSIPSPKSRNEKFYYAHPQNRFWKILSEIFDVEIKNDINLKKEFLLNNNIALWDVIKSCNIVGASDSTIKNIKINNLNMIIDNSNIKAVFTTGKKAYDLYMKYCYPKTQIKAIYLPSTSAANAKFNLGDLVNKYRIILKYLD